MARGDLKSDLNQKWFLAKKLTENGDKNEKKIEMNSYFVTQTTV
jgi:hypothetical protein